MDIKNDSDFKQQTTTLPYESSSDESFLSPGNSSLVEGLTYRNAPPNADSNYLVRSHGDANVRPIALEGYDLVPWHDIDHRDKKIRGVLDHWLEEYGLDQGSQWFPQTEVDLAPLYSQTQPQIEELSNPVRKLEPSEPMLDDHPESGRGHLYDVLDPPPFQRAWQAEFLDRVLTEELLASIHITPSCRSSLNSATVVRPVLKRYIGNLLDRPPEMQRIEVAGTDEILLRFLAIGQELRDDDKAHASHALPHGRERAARSAAVSSERVLDLVEIVMSVRPIWRFRLNLASRIVHDVKLWMSRERSSAVRTLLREFSRSIPEPEIEREVKRPLRENAGAALRESRLAESAAYLQALFGATLAIRERDEALLDEVLLPAGDALSQRWNEELAMAVAAFLAGAPKPRLVEVRNRFSALTRVWGLRGQHWVLREALR